MGRLVFVSYKRRTDTAAGADSEDLADAIAARLRPDYEVFVDKAIPVGNDWHRSIDRGLLLADAAVVLLSPAALTSPWVQYELSVLCFRSRWRSQGAPHLFIALVGGATVEALSQKEFRAMAADSYQAFRPRTTAGTAASNEYEDEASLCDQLVAAVAAAVPNRPKTPAERLVSEVQELLANLCDEDVIADLERALPLPLAPDAVPLRRLAEALLGLTLRMFFTVVDLIQSGLATKQRKAELTKDVETLIDHVFPFWVNAQAAGELALAAHAGEIPLLYAERAWTFEQYLRRAEERPDLWKPIDIRLPGTELDSQVVEQFARAAAPKVLGYDDETLKAMSFEDLLADMDYAQGKTTYFPLVDDVAAAKSLRDRGMNWIKPVVIGGPETSDGEARVVKPELDRQHEVLAYKTYLNVKRRLKP